MGSRIAKILEAKSEQGLTYEQLAGMSGISKSTISRTLSGKTEPSEYTIRKLEEALGVLNPMEEDPIMEEAKDSPLLRRYLMLLEDRINRMRAHNNMLLADKNRLLRNSVILNIIQAILNLVLVSFICYVLLWDLKNSDRGFIRGHLDMEPAASSISMVESREVT